ncbi:MAG: TIGR04255 family protein [Cyclobacteriaceae bacterium]
MEYLNHKITEAVCAFRFDPVQNNWDVTGIAEYYNEIKDSGFQKKQEIKPVQLSFQVKADEPPLSQNAEIKEGDLKMVFRNDDESFAILLGSNYLSFHTINHYPGWQTFNEKLINPYIEKYFKLGYGKGLLNAQMIYINNFDIENEKKLSNYLSFVPETELFGEGDEISHLFQSGYDISPNKRLQLKTIFNVFGPDKQKKVTLECNCIAKNDVNLDIDWSELALDAHDGAKNAFIKIATDEFKNEIK